MMPIFLLNCFYHKCSFKIQDKVCDLELWWQCLSQGVIEMQYGLPHPLARGFLTFISRALSIADSCRLRFLFPSQKPVCSNFANSKCSPAVSTAVQRGRQFPKRELRGKFSFTSCSQYSTILQASSAAFSFLFCAWSKHLITIHQPSSEENHDKQRPI